MSFRASRPDERTPGGLGGAVVVKVGRRVVPGSWPGGVRGPSDQALDRLAGRFAIGLRLGSAVAAAVAGPLAAVNGIAGIDLALVLVGLWAWSMFFVATVARRGLAWPLVLADAAVIMTIVAAQRYVVPGPSIADGTTWMLPLASTAVYIAALALSPWLSLPTAGAVTAVYVLTVPYPGDAGFLIVQALVTAALMTLVRRGGRSADSVIAGYLRAGQAARAEAARRADEREQYRRVHDTALSTLTMVASGAFSAPLATLRAQAAHDLQVLQALPWIPGGMTSDPASAVSLRDRLLTEAARAAPLDVTVSGTTVTPPPEVSAAISRCVGEALRNVARHAGTGRADVSVRDAGNGLIVEVSDQGRGFDPRLVAASRRGIRESIRGRMEALGGGAEVISAPGEGTRVVLRWLR
jgi:signal transduction histidine kinase